MASAVLKEPAHWQLRTVSSLFGRIKMLAKGRNIPFHYIIATFDPERQEVIAPDLIKI